MRTLHVLTIVLLLSGCAGGEETAAPTAAVVATAPPAAPLPPDEPLPTTTADAVRQFEKLRWRKVRAEGIPNTVPGFAVTRYHEGTRTDLVAESGIYVIYWEFLRDDSGRDFRGVGDLHSLPGTGRPVYRLETFLAESMGRENFEDLVGFAGGRLFTIHAWARIAEPTESPRAVALRVAEQAGATLEAQRRARKKPN